MKAVIFEGGSRYSHFQLFNFLSGEWFDISESDFDNQVVRFRSLFDMTYKDGVQYFNTKGLNIFEGYRRF